MKAKRKVGPKRKRKNKRDVGLGNNVKNLVSIILPMVTIFIIALSYDSAITGYAVYEGEEKAFYRIDGKVNINISEEIPLDAYIKIRISDYKVKVNIVEFLDMSGKEYWIDSGYIFGDGVYSVDFEDLGIFEVFEEGSHEMSTEIVSGWSVLYRDEQVILAGNL